MPLAAVGHPDSAAGDIVFVGNFFDVHRFGQDMHNHGFTIQWNDSHPDIQPFHKIPDVADFCFLGIQKTRRADQVYFTFFDAPDEMPLEVAEKNLAENDVNFSPGSMIIIGILVTG
jgi:hypothetical protein